MSLRLIRRLRDSVERSVINQLEPNRVESNLAKFNAEIASENEYYIRRNELCLRQLQQEAEVEATVDAIKHLDRNFKQKANKISSLR